MIRTVFVFLMVFWASMKMLAHVELKSPEGGETYYPGETVNIVWVETISHSSQNWDLLYSTDGGVSWIVLKEDVALEARNYQWTVPDVSTAKARIKVIQDNNGEDYESSSQNFTIVSATGIQNSFEHTDFRIFPNPMTDIAVIEFENPNNDQHSLTIYNIQGVVVRTITQISSGKIDMQRDNLPAGRYFIQLSNEQQVRGRGNLMIHGSLTW